MSLSSLMKLRLQGKRPAGPVTVLVGKRPSWREDDETLVVITPAAEPALMDFRPLVGLWTTLVVLGDNYQHAGRVLAAIDAAGAKLFGAALPCGTYPCLQNPTEQHHRVLRETRKALCQ